LSDGQQVLPFGLGKGAKDELLLSELNRLTELHLDACPEYSTVVRKFGGKRSSYESVEKIPFIPVRLFKHFKLLSVPKEEVVKTMTSSGTSGQSVSQIFLDRKTSALQIKVLSKIMSDFIGPKRLPMLVIDSRPVINFQQGQQRFRGFLCSDAMSSLR